MTTRQDSLSQRLRPDVRGAGTADRVYYANGVHLDADDFNADQDYHRSRLARALSYLHGHGTVAGLDVRWLAALEAGVDEAFPEGREEILMVEAGLAVDRLGRLIEVPRAACIRLARWYTGESEDDLQQGFHADQNGVIVDLFVRFVACERGKQPSFASGPYEALDALAPARLRDSYELELVIRKEENPEENLPVSPWAAVSTGGDPTARLAELHTAILAAWRDGTEDWDRNGPEPLAEHAVGLDPTSVFLARLTIPTAAPVGNAAPVPIEDADVAVDNTSRLFVYTPNAVAHLLGA